MNTRFMECRLIINAACRRSLFETLAIDNLRTPTQIEHESIKNGIFVSPTGVRCVCLRHNLEIMHYYEKLQSILSDITMHTPSIAENQLLHDLQHQPLTSKHIPKN
jgi:hypothetical protein